MQGHSSRTSNVATSSSLDSKNVRLLTEEHIRNLAHKRNATVYTVQHTSIHEPWKVERVRRVSAKIINITRSQQLTPPPLSDSRLESQDESSELQAKGSSRDVDAHADVVEFERDHPHLYKMLSNPQMVNDDRFIQAFEALLRVREDVELGRISASEADSTATSTLMSALAHVQHN